MELVGLRKMSKTDGYSSWFHHVSKCQTLGIVETLAAWQIGQWNMDITHGNVEPPRHFVSFLRSLKSFDS